MQETWVQSLGWEDPLEKEMATHSSIPAWRIPWTEEPGGLQSMEVTRVVHDLATSQPPPHDYVILLKLVCCPLPSCFIMAYCLSLGEGNGNPLQYSCLENSMDRGAWWAAVHGIAKSWKRLSDFHSQHLARNCYPIFI